MHNQPQNLLQNRIILVTGASDGIGREAALTYSEYGASLILLGRNEEKLKAVAREIENAGGTPPVYARSADLYASVMSGTCPAYQHALSASGWRTAQRGVTGRSAPDG